MVSIKKVTIFSLPIKLYYVALLPLEEPTIFAVVFYLAIALRRTKFSMLVGVFIIANPNLWSNAEVSVFYISIHYFCVCSTGYQDHK